MIQHNATRDTRHNVTNYDIAHTCHEFTSQYT